MARPHIEFVQAQALPWKELGETTARPGIGVKVLSRDPDKIGATVILRYPKGWTFEQHHHLNSDEELYVLSGRLMMDDKIYEEGDYAFLPAGHEHRIMSAPEGADILTYFDGPLRRIAGAPDKGVYEDHRLIECLSTTAATWTNATDPKVISPDVRLLVLRTDPQTGERTWLLDVGPEGMCGDFNATETHPVVEEVFFLSGSIHGPMGVLRKGAYFWRPPGIAHGPFGSKEGCLGIYRCKGGPLTTAWSDERYAVPWESPYKPILPDEVTEKLASDYEASLPY